nr:polymeric immunoglobulin receptor [Pelodiscus sinensis]XP_025034348.1 polymeric immunoglobulin receptor [Pelodiscus sinensis]|eukprot:XP_025034347.1 polymeric immunoglobulin receptor [Pelodiscus sinensis]
MTFLVFIFLLSFLQVESAKISSSSSIFGPRQVTGLLGGSVTVKCFYPRTNVNRHDRKYWCKESTRQCATVISSNGYIAQDFAGRATITDFPEQGIFIMELSKLGLKDIGFYKCGIGLNDRGLSFEVKLDVSQGPKVPEGAELYYKELGGSVTMNCVFGTQYASVRKYLCKMGKTGCSTVIDTYGNVNPTYKGRALLSPQETPGSFVIYMTQLRKEDSGLYLCGVGEYGETGESKELDMHVYQETAVPQGRHTINGVIGGSVSVECRYDPRRNYTLKYLCKWRKNGCTQLITNLIMMIDSYEGRIVMHDNPKNGTFTIIMNQLVAEDAGYYWCMTDGDVERKSSKELKIIDGQPGLTGLKEVNAVIGTRVTLSCSYPCKYYSYQKYWCKWNNRGCKPLVSYEQNQTSPAVNCDEENKTLYLTFNQVTQTNQGWYWCGVSHSGHYGETMAVFLRVNGGTIPRNADYEEPDISNSGSGKRADFPADSSSPSSQEHDNSKVILSVLIPIAVVCLLLGTVFVVVKFKLLKRTELVSVGSYRTNISMSEFDNPRELGAKENAGINNSQETQIGGVDEFVTVPANTESAEEPKVVKRVRTARIYNLRCRSLFFFL